MTHAEFSVPDRLRGDFGVFVVPDDQEVLEAIGEWPETEEDGEARVLTLPGEGDEQILNIFREGATHMRVHSSSGSTYFSIEFQMGEWAGKMSIRVSPNLAVTDQLLSV